MKNERLLTGFMITLAVILGLLPGFWFAWVPVLGFYILILLSNLELSQLLKINATKMGLIKTFLGVTLGLSPLLALYFYGDLSGWQVLPFFKPLLSEELLQNDTWRVNFLWLLSIGFLFYVLSLFFFLQFIVILTLYRKGAVGLVDLTKEILSVLYLSFPLASLALLLIAVPNGLKWLIFCLLIVVTTDISAYYFGTAALKRERQVLEQQPEALRRPFVVRIVPKLSPNKTLTGTVWGLVFAVIISIVYSLLFLGGGKPQFESFGLIFFTAILMGFFISLSGQFGDWVASAIKRFAGAKDFGKLLKGHGGVLDRIDGFLYAIPTTLFCTIIYYLLELN